MSLLLPVTLVTGSTLTPPKAPMLLKARADEDPRKCKPWNRV